MLVHSIVVVDRVHVEHPVELGLDLTEVEEIVRLRLFDVPLERSVILRKQALQLICVCKLFSKGVSVILPTWRLTYSRPGVMQVVEIIATYSRPHTPDPGLCKWWRSLTYSRPGVMQVVEIIGRNLVP